jgi:hypothetical protein
MSITKKTIRGREAKKTEQNEDCGSVKVEGKGDKNRAPKYH